MRNLNESVVIKAGKQTLTGENVAPKSHPGAGTTIACQITPEQTQAAFDRFGTELNRPFLLLADAVQADGTLTEDLLPVGASVLWGTRTLEVAAPAQTFRAGRPSDNCAAILKDSQYDG